MNRVFTLAVLSLVSTLAACGRAPESRSESQTSAVVDLFQSGPRIAAVTSRTADVIGSHTYRFMTDNITWRRAQFNSLTLMARCIAVVSSGQVGWGLGGVEVGAGMASCRTVDGTWSTPSYVNLLSGTLGAIIGAEYRETVLLFLSESSVHNLMRAADVTLGAGVRAAAFDANLGVDVTTAQQQDIVTFTYTRGLIAEASLQGSILRHMTVRNNKVYGQPVLPGQLLTANQGYTPAIALPFVYALNAMDQAAHAPFSPLAP